jgi:hypothetical protein
MGTSDRVETVLKTLARVAEFVRQRGQHPGERSLGVDYNGDAILLECRVANDVEFELFTPG